MTPTTPIEPIPRPLGGRSTREVVLAMLRDLRDEERRHHGPREPCEYGRGGIETLEKLARELDEQSRGGTASVLVPAAPAFEGQTYCFKAQAGRADGQVIARGPDGRVCFFDRHAPLSSEIRPQDKVVGRILLVGEHHMVVEPLKIVGQYEVPDDGMPEPISGTAQTRSANMSGG